MYNLVQELSRQGAFVTTISPMNAWRGLRLGGMGYGRELSRVIRPRYVSWSNKTVYPGISSGRMSAFAFKGAVQRGAREIERPDVVYSHFLFPAGYAALKIAEEYRVPAVVALGESSMERHERTHGVSSVREHINRFDHVITVSSLLRDYCVERMDVDPTKVSIIPNAVDTTLFQAQDRQLIRGRLGLPSNAFTITYLGHFNDRKGYARVLSAMERLPDIKGIFIGDGPKYPKGEQVLFAGPLKHSAVPEWLAAGDIFVLPTLAEGYCNAVNEALAMGLPLVVSDIPELREQADESVAIFVNPNDVDHIADAIAKLYSDVERHSLMAKAALRLGQSRSLSTRANKILNLLHELVKSNSDDLRVAMH